MPMQVVEKSGDGLSRVYGVTVPAQDLAERLSARIAEVAPQMNIKGFRPGKVPAAHVRRVYGKALMSEVLEQALSESTQQVLNDNNLRPASEPDLQPQGDLQAVIAGSADLEYDIAIDIMPDFEPVDLTTLELTRPVYTPTDDEVDDALKELAKQNRTFEDRPEGGKAETGDEVTINFVGRIDGEAFNGGSADDVNLVLGSGQFIPGFEDQLVGATAGQDLTVKVAFPADYMAENLAGKDAEFETKVTAVKAPVEAEVNDEMATRLGIDSLDKLKELLRENLQNQYAGASRFKLKRALLDALDSKHDFPLPPKMVENEFNIIWEQLKADKESGQLPPEDTEKTEEQLESEYRKIAGRRVRLGLILAEVGRLNNIAVADQELEAAIRQEAMRYGQQAQQVIEFYRQNAGAQAQLRAPIYEEKVVDFMIDKAKVSDSEVTKDELLKDDELPEGYAAA